MKKTLSLLLLTTTVALAGCNSSLEENNTPNAEQTATTQQVETIMETAVMDFDNYANYSDQALQTALNDGKNVVLFVHNTGCGSCNLLDGNIKKDASLLPDEAMILKIDYATQKDVMKKFDVDTYHTLIYLDADGKETSRVKGTTFTIDDVLNDWPVVEEAQTTQDAVQDTSATTTQEVATTKKMETISTETPTTSDDMMEQKGEYVVYSKAALNEALGAQKDVVLFVHNKGCGSCNLLDGNIKKDLSLLPENMTVLKVDYSTQKDVMKEFNIDSYHTLVYLDANGKEISRVKGITFTVNDIIASK